LVYGEDFEDLMLKHLFSKLGMQHTGYHLENRSQSPSGGMTAPFSDLLCGLNWVTGRPKIGGLLSPGSWKQMQSIEAIRKNQRSGYGFAVKIFQESGTPICSVTGYFGNTYIVQMWSEKYRMGYIGAFYGFSEDVRKTLNTRDVFFNQIQEMEGHSSVPERFTKMNRGMNTHRPIQTDGAYISLDGQVLYLRQAANTVSLSWNQTVWEELDWGEGDCLLDGCDELVLDLSRDKVSGIFYNGAGYFDYFFYNGSLNFHMPSGVERIFALDSVKAKTEEDRSRLRLYKRFKRIVLTYTTSGLYFNGLYALEHLYDNIYLKATGEPVVIENDAIWVGNLKYTELPLNSDN
jgi:hypothetical protein